MLNTYQMKPFLVSQVRRTDNSFFYVTLMFSVFLYFFSLYFIFQSTEIVKHTRSGSAVSLNAGPIHADHTVQNPAYEANFGENQILFKPKSSSSGKTELGFELIKIESGKDILYSSGMAQNRTPQVKEHMTSYQKSDQMKEIYESRSNGLEQSWVFEKPFFHSHKKDVAVIQKLTTRLVPQYGPGGEINFHDGTGNYVTTYGKGTLKDSAGRTIDILPRFIGGSIRGTYELVMTLPGKWLANAAFPVVLDPLIGYNVQLDTLTGGDYRPSVAFDGVNYMVVWMNGSAPGAVSTGVSNIYGAVVSPAGTVVASPFIIENSKNDQMYPSVAYNAGNNNFLIVYQNYVGKSGKNDIYGKVISYSGNAVTRGNSSAIAATNADEQFPTVSTDGTTSTNNNYVAYLAGNTVKAIPVSTSIAGIVTPGTAVTLGTVTTSTAPSILPQIAFSNGALNRYFVAWENFSSADASGNIYGNSITKGSSSPGLSNSAPLGIAVTTSTPERYPALAFDGNKFFVTYQRSAAGASDIYGQFVTSASGSTLSGTNFIVSNNPGNQTTPKVAYNTVSGAYLVAWTDSRNSAANTDIYGSRVTPGGSVLDPAGINISNIGTSSKQTPAIASGGPNGYVVWNDSATNSGNIYGQLFGPPQIAGLSGSVVEARNPLTINSILYGNNGTFGADPGSANRSTAANNVTIGTYQLGSSDVTSWSLTPGINSSIGIIAPYAAAVSGGTGIGASAVTGTGWTGGLSSALTIQDYALGVSPASATVVPGGNATYTVTLNAVNGFSAGVALSMASACPTNATCSFSPNFISGNGATSTLTVATTASAAGGSTLLTIQGTGGSNNQLIHVASVSLTISSATRLAITSAPQTVSPGLASAAVTVQAQDSSGNMVTSSTASVNLSSTSGTMIFSTSSAFTTTIRSLVLSGGTGTFYFKDATTGTPVITAASSGLTSASQTETVTSGAATKIVITSAAQTVAAGSSSSAVTLQAQDAYGNAVTSSTAVVNLSSTSGTMVFSTSSAFTTTITSLVLSGGTGTFYFKDTTAGAPVITATSTGLTSATQTETISGSTGGATKLAITSAAQTVAAGSASSAVTLQAQDANGNLVTSSTATVNLSSTSGTMTFSGSSAFTTTITSLVLSSGTGTFYFKDSTAGTPTIAAASSGLTSAVQTETISGSTGSATKIVITSASQTLTVGTSSAAVTVQAQDSLGNLVTGSTAVVGLTSTSGAMVFSTSSAFTTITTSITLSSGAGTFYFKDTTTGMPVITAASIGLTSASQTETVTSGAASRLAITSVAQTVAAGSASSAVTLQAQDAYGNVVTSSTATVNLSSTSGTMTFSGNSAFTTTITGLTLSSGSGTFYFKDSTAGTPVITAASAGLTSATQTETISGSTGGATKLAITSAAQTVAAGVASTGVTIQAQDSTGNLVTSSTATVNLSSTSGTMVFSTSSAFSTITSSITLSSGAGTFYFKDTTAGAPAITVASSGLASASQTETVVTGGATKIVINSLAQTVTAGLASGTVTVQAQDSSGNLVTSSTATVNLSSTSGTMVFSSSSAFTTITTSITLSSGAGTFYFKDTTTGMPVITAASIGLTSASQTETVTSGAASRLAITSVAQTVAAGSASSAVTLQAQDAYGNVVTSSTATVNLSSTSGTMTFSGSSAFTATITSLVLSGGTGTFYFKDASTGTPTITAAAAGLTSVTQTETIQ